MKQMEERWNQLDPSDKSYYKQKLTENKQTYQNLKGKYLQSKERLDTQAARENINFSTTEVSSAQSLNTFVGPQHAVERRQQGEITRWS